MRALGVLPPDIEPRATEHLAGIIRMISGLIDSGHAYAADGHVLFRVRPLPTTAACRGAISANCWPVRGWRSRPTRKMPVTSCCGSPRRRNCRAGTVPGAAAGRAGISSARRWSPSTSGRTIDIHGGGNDLIFPHHENEIAQSTCANGGVLFARYWLHNGFVNVDHTKMSKSLGNVLLVRDLLKQAPGEAIRLALLSAHYRQPLDWTSEVLPEAQRKLDRLYGALRDVEGWQGLPAEPDPDFIAALDDDLNTPQALAVLFNLARDANRSADPAERASLAARLHASAALLGLLGTEPDAWFMSEVSDGLSAEQIETMLAARRAARASRDFKLADRSATSWSRLAS